eukprot:6104513-Pleurochrysis_carterae.AAC.2
MHERDRVCVRARVHLRVCVRARARVLVRVRVRVRVQHRLFRSTALLDADGLGAAGFAAVE